MAANHHVVLWDELGILSHEVELFLHGLGMWECRAVPAWSQDLGMPGCSCVFQRSGMFLHLPGVLNYSHIIQGSWDLGMLGCSHVFQGFGNAGLFLHLPGIPGYSHMLQGP